MHFGATSQDVIDTAIMLQVKEALRLTAEGLQKRIGQVILFAEKHRATVMVGHSFMQQARPITFGFKVAGWLAPLLRFQKAIEELLQDGFVLQLGGAVGTLSSLPEKGREVSATVSEFLRLNNPVKPWHTKETIS